MKCGGLLIWGLSCSVAYVDVPEVGFGDDDTDAASQAGSCIADSMLYTLLETTIVPRVVGLPTSAFHADWPPTVYANDGTHDWLMKSNWSLKTLVDEIGSVKAPLLRSDSPLLWLYDDNMKISTPEGVPRPHDVIELSFSDIVKAITGESNQVEPSESKDGVQEWSAVEPDHYFHFHVPLQNLSKALARDTHNKDVVFGTWDSPKPPRIPEPYLTMSTAGTSSVLHYAEQFRFMAQSTGTTKALLFPPRALTSMYLFPYNHPHRFCSQLQTPPANLRNYPAAVQLRKRGVTSQEVTLEEGDALYVPPYWLIILTEINTGVRIDLKQDAPFQELVNRLLQRTVPELPKGFTLDQTISVGRHFLNALLRSLQRKMPQHRYPSVIHKHYKQRYERLTGVNTISLISIKVKRYCKEPMTLETMPITSSNLMKLTRKAYERLEQLAEVMPLDTFEVVLGDYLDLVALQSVQGHHQSVAAFFSNCFAFTDV
uniref:Cupin-like domain-containing protein n=1 Tax=Eutreptiella gymnastica TaxID=73025 RepID=A0A7S1IF36_9EUGL|mmetsp:Transcript_152885/g.267151  ORF Transcript_152885/g.267151 Transcript_152885/m.267151 type:complete len:485 (+) Transcript_152885:3-1457(+)